MAWKLNRATGRVYEVPPFEKTGDFEALTASLTLAKERADAKSAPRLPAAFAGRGIDNSQNQMANESAKRAMLANAESEENQARECDRKADAARETLLRAPSDLVSYYSTKEREHRVKAQEHRDAAKAHRRAAEGI